MSLLFQVAACSQASLFLKVSELPDLFSCSRVYCEWVTFFFFYQTRLSRLARPCDVERVSFYRQMSTRSLSKNHPTFAVVFEKIELEKSHHRGCYTPKSAVRTVVQGSEDSAISPPEGTVTADPREEMIYGGARLG